MKENDEEKRFYRDLHELMRKRYRKLNAGVMACKVVEAGCSLLLRETGSRTGTRHIINMLTDGSVSRFAEEDWKLEKPSEEEV